MARKNLLTDLIESTPPDQRTPQSSKPVTNERVPTLGSRGAVGAMSRSLEQLTAEREAAKAISEQLANGESVLEIETDLVEDTLVPDRMQGSDPNFEVLKESIGSSGQLVPALVRPHPSETGRYQIAYGRRRLRAQRELGNKLRAVVQNLSDDDLVIAQGKENAERENLTFIERARYAALLEDKTFKRDTIMAALSVDKTELSRLISIYRAIPAGLTDAIGSAPKVGRRRWMELVDRLGDATDLGALLASDKFNAASSDDRFGMVLSVAAARERRTAREAKAMPWTGRDGKKVATINKSAGRFILSVDEKIAPAFGDFVLDRLPDLYDAFRQSKEGQ